LKRPVVNSIPEIMMSRTILAEYDAEHKTLKLEEPLEGIEDREKVKVAVEPNVLEDVERPWMRFEGSLPHEIAEKIRRTLEDASAPDHQ
jgi:hypothetical protein